MKKTLMIVGAFVIVLIGFSSCEINFLVYCPNVAKDPCYENGGEPVMEDSCTEGKTCFTNACTRYCKEPANIDCTPTQECTCSYDYTNENLCSEDQVCCYENCTHICKDKRYTYTDKSTYNITGQGCCDDGLKLLSFFGGNSEIYCSERKTCVINGCRTKCIGPVFSNDSCTDPTNQECKCVEDYTYEDSCSDDEFCCEENCTYVCKENIPIIVNSTTNITGKGCCYIFPFIQSEESSCSEGKTCVVNGCRTECKEIVFLEEGCSYEYTDQDNCSDEQECCSDGNCGFTCKEKRYAKKLCPDYSLSPLECIFQILNNDCGSVERCYYWQMCCPEICPLKEICATPFYKRAVCPDNYETNNFITEPEKCFSNSTCTDNNKLCCRLYSDRNDTYCREPKYVDDKDLIVLVLS